MRGAGTLRGGAPGAISRGRSRGNPLAGSGGVLRRGTGGACLRLLSRDTALNTTDVLDVALAVAQALERCDIGYFLGGSLASSYQGELRATNAIDFVVALSGSDAMDADCLARWATTLELDEWLERARRESRLP
jgi:hypothetical protein